MDRFPLKIDFNRGGVERIEAHFDGFAGPAAELRRNGLQQESAIAAFTELPPERTALTALLRC
jgi:hypothetical protein